MVRIKNIIIFLIFLLNAIGITLNFVFISRYSSGSTSSESDKVNLVLILNCLCIYFTLTFLFTFNFDNPQQNQATQSNLINQPNQQNERNQRNNAHNNGAGGISSIDCGGGGGGGDCAPLLIIVFAAVAFVILIFLIVQIYQSLGKKNTVYCSLIFLLIIYMGMSITCFGLIHQFNLYIIGGISSCLFIFNFLIILIPNCRKRQRNNDLENIEIKDQMLMQENGNNNILVSDNSVTTPIYNQEYNSKINDIGKPIENISASDVYERNNEKYDQCFDDKNEFLNNQNDQINQTPNSRISDLSNAPLPNDVNLPTEEEINKNYSNL